MKEQLIALQKLSNECRDNVENAIRTLTADNPLVLFDKDKIDSCSDELYDFPFGYYIGRYDTYNQGAIQRVCGDDVTIFLTGEQFGEEWELNVADLPFYSQVELLTYLIERM